MAGLGLASAVLVAAAVWGRSGTEPTALRLKADAAARAGKWEEALRAWRQVNGTEAADARSWLGEARAALALNRAAQAERALEEASRLDPSEPEPWLIRLELLRLEDRPHEAHRVGWAAWEAVRPGARREVLRALTLALLADAPDELARTTLARWIAADTDDRDARVALYRRMAEHPRSGDPAAAERAEALAALLDEAPGHVGAREALVLALAESGQATRGRDALDAWPVEARDARYDRLRGRWDLEYDDRPDRAAEALRRALDALPHDWKTLYRLARALQRLDRAEEARRAADDLARLREALDPSRLGPRLDADLARLDDPAARRDLAALCASVGLSRLADAWRRVAETPLDPAGGAAGFAPGLIPPGLPRPSPHR